MKANFYRGVLALVLLLLTQKSAPALVIFNEILADPGTGIEGDANLDGVRDTNDDEFIELYNAYQNPVDLSGWFITDATRTRHIFPGGSLLQPQGLFLVFGGGAPQVQDAPWQTASSGTLGLNNTGETVTLYDSTGVLREQVIYGSEAGDDQSISRFPEGTEAGFIKHTLMAKAEGRRFSPGFFIDRPAPIDNNPGPQQAAVPEVPSLYQLVMGCVMSFWALRKR